MAFTRHRMQTALLIIFVTLASVTSLAEKMAIIGDAGEAGRELNELRASIEKENIRSLILPGDNLYKGKYKSTWDIWKLAGFKFDVVAIGNHSNGYREEITYFQMPGENYSIVRNGARFIVLNSDNILSVEEQFRWLNEEIFKVKEKIIFLVYHHPTFTVGGHLWTEKKTFQVKIRKFLDLYESKITAVISGHEHMGSFVDFGKVPVIISGAGREAEAERGVSYDEAGRHIKTRYISKTEPQWAELDINSKTQEVLVRFVRVADQRTMCSARIKNSVMQLEGDCR